MYRPVPDGTSQFQPVIFIHRGYSLYFGSTGWPLGQHLVKFALDLRDHVLWQGDTADRCRCNVEMEFPVLNYGHGGEIQIHVTQKTGGHCV